MIEMLHHF